MSLPTLHCRYFGVVLRQAAFLCVNLLVANWGGCAAPPPKHAHEPWLVPDGTISVGGRRKVGIHGCFHPGRNSTVSRQKSIDRKNFIMPTVERHSITSGFSQYGFLANPCKILCTYRINICLMLTTVFDLISEHTPPPHLLLKIQIQILY